jgi:hypothetical protein
MPRRRSSADSFDAAEPAIAIRVTAANETGENKPCETVAVPLS